MTTMPEARDFVLSELKALHRATTIRHLQTVLDEVLTPYQVEMAVKDLVKTADIIWNIDGVYLPKYETA